jgi:excisionase family DNA binding protein
MNDAEDYNAVIGTLAPTALSPKQLAEAIGVSESSVKRWIDEGRIAATRTCGGHRRVTVVEALRFIRETGITVADPAVLGLTTTSSDAIDQQLYEAMIMSDADSVRELLFTAYVSSRSVASLADGPIRNAMGMLGELWLDGPKGVCLEHQGTAAVMAAMHQLRMLMPNLPTNAPVAVGGSLEDDTHVLPCVIVGTVLKEVGMRDVNLGGVTPVAAFQHAIEQHRPKLVWVSVSVTEPSPRRKADFHTLAEIAEQHACPIVIGGRGASTVIDNHTPRSVIIAQTMSELAAFASGLRCGTHA